jgi:hypothetical protein
LSIARSLKIGKGAALGVVFTAILESPNLTMSAKATEENISEKGVPVVSISKLD